MPLSENKRITIIGASLGGLVAAAECRSRGFQVRILEKGKTIGGLYAKTETPFGVQELGMHVVYATDSQLEHISNIFGKDSFEALFGVEVDLGASANGGKLYLNSHYPNVLNHPKRDLILKEIVNSEGSDSKCDARSVAIASFGSIAAEEIICPILKKLWGMDAYKLTDKALHCFFDLRRIVVCSKADADKYKADPRLDRVIANPMQTQPYGKVFGGRSGIFFKNSNDGLDRAALLWAQKTGVQIEFEQQIEWKENHFEINGDPLDDSSHSYIFAVPIHALIKAKNLLETIDLSIYYIELEKKITQELPAYYILCHDSNLVSSRIVHYDGYRKKVPAGSPTIISIEALHRHGEIPKKEDIAKELLQVLPSSIIKNTYRFPKALPLPLPSLNNKQILDEFESNIRRSFPCSAVYFTGMRTDQGVFFSHQTIGAAYESALDCIKRIL
jgi:hypothetical protein